MVVCLFGWLAGWVGVCGWLFVGVLVGGWVSWWMGEWLWFFVGGWVVVDELAGWMDGRVGE